MVDHEIRELERGDEELLRVLALESAAFEEEEVERPGRPLGAADARAFLDDPSAHLWVAVSDDVVVGFVLAYTMRRRHGDPAQLYIYELGVRSGWRRRGVATGLIEHVLCWAHTVGLTRGFVLTGERNAGAIAFYESLGWRADDEHDVIFAFTVGDRSSAPDG